MNQTKLIDIYVEICRKDAILPRYANDGDSGMDVYSAVDYVIEPGETAAVPTGIKLAIPEGYEIQVRPRSGLSLNTPLRITNSPGTIDPGYRDEVAIIVTNSSDRRVDKKPEEVFNIDSKDNKKGTYWIRRGDRIAQLVLQVVPRMKLNVVDSVSDIGRNRQGGFGSTGTR